MPWPAFVFNALAVAWKNARHPERSLAQPRQTQSKEPDVDRLTSAARTVLPRDFAPSADLLLLLWAAVPLLFFSLSTRQEYYVLPALPAIVILIADWLAKKSLTKPEAQLHRKSAYRCTVVVLALGTIFAAGAIYFIMHTQAPAPNTDLASLLQQNPGDYAMSMGHFLDLNAQALSLFRLPLAIAAASLFLGPLASFLLRKRAQPHAATLALAAGAFGFLLAAHLGLRTFAPVLSSQQLAKAIAPQVHPNDLIVIHQEYEYGSTLGFYLQRPSYHFFALRISPHQTTAPTDHDSADVTMKPIAVNPIHILTDSSYHGTPDYGRSSNLWYGSFFPDAPPIFETTQTLVQKWSGPQRIFLWQDLAGEPSPLPAALSPVYVIAKSGGKEIVSNQRNRP